MNGIREQKQKYQVYLSIKDSVKIVHYPSKMFDVYNNSTMSDKTMDSLINYCNFKYIFDDTIFHLEKPILLVDTFGFFSNNCIENASCIRLTKNYNEIRDDKSKIDMINLVSIRVYKNNFIISLQHMNSEIEVQFYFLLIANREPELVNIIKGFAYGE